MPTVRVAIVTQDVIGHRLAGPAIRSLAMARALADQGHEVQVHSTMGASAISEVVVPGRMSSGTAHAVRRWAEAVVIQGDVLDERPALGRGDGLVVCDLYDPFQMEGLVRGVHLPLRARYGATRRALSVLSGQLERGDLFLCASERQRLFWLGHLDAAGRLNPASYDADPSFTDLLMVVPFGIDEAPPSRTGPGLVGRVAGVDEGSRVLLWGGGVYDWLDPLPLIEAVGMLASDLPELRLVFMGTTHPNPAVAAPTMLGRARTLTRSLGLEQAVLFHDGWVPYEERHNVLLDAEIGVSGHVPHIETTLAFRTRILDYIWAGLPIVTTSGDALGDLVDDLGLGVVVPPRDPSSVAAGLRSLLTETGVAHAVRSRVQAVAPTMRWSVVLRPLLDYCANPQPAADRDAVHASRLRADRRARGHEQVARVTDTAAAAWAVLRREGLGGVRSKVVARARGGRRL